MEITPAIEAIINKYFPKSIPDLVLPEVHNIPDLVRPYSHYDFPSKYGTKSISRTFDDEKDIRENIWLPAIKHGDVVFDIGADHGSYTLPALVRGAYVVAVTPENYDYLCHNLKLNGLLLPDKSLPIEAAFYSANGYLDFMRQQFFPTEHLGAFKVTTIDEVFAGWDQPVNLMKFDVEGAELEVMHGGISLIKRTMPKILVECHEFKQPGISNEVMKLIDGLQMGYRWQMVDRRATKFIYFST